MKMPGKGWFTLTCNCCYAAAGLLKQGGRISLKCPCCGRQETIYGLAQGKKLKTANKTIEAWKRGEKIT